MDVSANLMEVIEVTNVRPPSTNLDDVTVEILEFQEKLDSNLEETTSQSLDEDSDRWLAHPWIPSELDDIENLEDPMEAEFVGSEQREDSLPNPYSHGEPGREHATQTMPTQYSKEKEKKKRKC